MLSELIKPESVIVGLESSDKDSLFAELVESLVRCNSGLDRDEIIEGLNNREALMNTCIMKGIAVPHTSCKCTDKPLIAIGLSSAGIDYEIEGAGTKDYDEKLVHLVFMILFEQGNAERHLHVLADCARVLHIPGFYRTILGAKSAQEVCNIIREFETEY